MLDSATAGAIGQLDAVLLRIDEIRPEAKYDDLSDLPKSTLHELQTLAQAAVERIAPSGSSYRSNADKIVGSITAGPALVALSGVLNALRADVEAGYLRTTAELIHANVFADFLEMASHLLSSGYKDAAAVIAGSTLEEHLRKLCEKTGITTADAQGRPRKADTLNADLAKGAIYNQLRQKSVTAWLGLRNDAAHGHYDRYDARQVEGLIRDVRDFMIRLPA